MYVRYILKWIYEHTINAQKIKSVILNAKKKKKINKKNKIFRVL